MSHANVYRFFPSRQALVEEVSRRWLRETEGELNRIPTGPGSAATKLRAFALGLHGLKREKVLADRDVFERNAMAAEASPEALGEHLEALTALLRRILLDGMHRGEFDAEGIPLPEPPAPPAIGCPADPSAVEFEEVVTAVESAILRFRHPIFVLQDADRGVDTVPILERLLDLLVEGLSRGLFTPRE